MLTSTPEQDAYMKTMFGLDVGQPAGDSDTGGGGGSGSDGSGSPGVSAAPAPADPAGPPPGFIQPPDDVLRRTGDGAIFWQPNTATQTTGGPPVAPAGSKWINDFLTFYGLAPGADPTSASFNGAATSVDAIAQLASAQAQLAGFVAASGDVTAAAQKVLNGLSKARTDGDALAKSETVISDAEIAALAKLPFTEMLEELETIRKDGQLDAIAGRAKDPRLRLAVLSVKHDLSDEWAKLLKTVSDDDGVTIRTHVYGKIVGGDLGDGAAPPVDAPTDGKSSRPLTSAEKAYLKAVFHDTIDYTKVTITKGSVLSVGSTPRTTGNTINFPSASFVKDSLELLPSETGTLVHESTHVWQNQNRGWTYAPAALWAQLKAVVTTFDRNNAYKWEDQAKKGGKWDDLNPEQQGDAVEKYNAALRRVQNGSTSPDDYYTLQLVQPWIAVMLAGPKK